MVVTRLWYATALLQAGRPADALLALDEADRDAEDAMPAESATRIELRLARADALLAVDRAAEALTIYADVWQRSAEQTEPWWHAFTGSLQCHARLDADPSQIAQSIRQQRFLAPDLGGGRWKHAIGLLEQDLSRQTTTAPSR
ncbi:MAG: hypothetical protein HY718_14975 [Planctomycetes bacterium]|nr:hypothetical protein [Planctomycetota bacterium]